MGNGVAFFEIGTDDPVGLERFYSDVFGWTFTAGHGDSYRIIRTQGKGISLGGLWDSKQEPDNPLPANYAIFAIEVDDVVTTCERVTRAGGKLIDPPMPGPDGIVVLAHVRDPLGNHIAVFHSAFTHEEGERG
ncbi:VOC family protein [Nocardia pseudobrasiliensis]|uniref:VOC domain-containing protein n=1 Tax=Nocardia pseudobrasiliensis TaxID=45979 RepID=A0A370IDC2_9NOCA|nr:VOC family protein [Nocardia pseudobrasiliensis]RDI68131.1 hypothetical protein DFR76_102532 [Nocardia pseudobrasiliensis]